MLVVLLVLRTQYTDESLWRSCVPVLVCQINAAVRKHDTVLYV